MLRFSRSESKTAASASPDPARVRLADSAGAKAWLGGMTEPGSVDNLAEIARVLKALGATGDHGASEQSPARRFAILDRIRTVVVQVLWERARDDELGALPVRDEFAHRFWPAIEAAEALRDAYAWLVSQLPDPNATTSLNASHTGAAPSVSGIEALHRALDVNAQLLLVIQRAHWPVPVAIWDRHCVLGQLVRDLDCQDVEVLDPAKASSTQNCRAAFTLPVLVALADPASKSGVEYDVLRMATQRWSAKVGFRIDRAADVPASPGRPVPNPGPTVTLGAWLVRFDTQSAIQSIERRLQVLAEGKSPREAGMGDALRAQPARELLAGMRQRWGSVTPAQIDFPDRAWRAAGEDARLRAVVGVAAAAVDGRAPSGETMTPATRTPDTYVYHRTGLGSITKPRSIVENERIARLLARAETWSLVAESRDVLRCVRRHPRPRLGLHRLVALQLGEQDAAGPLLLGWVEALQSLLVAVDDRTTGHTDAHTVRVRLAPGRPLMLRVSVTEEELPFAFLLLPRGARETPREPVGAPPPASTSFFPMPGTPTALPSVPTETAAESPWDAVRRAPREHLLVLPHALFRLHREVRALRDGAMATLRLDELMMRGADFDLVRFTVV